MATKILKSIKGKTVRLTRLDECGTVISGTCSTLVSDCFVNVTLTGEFEAGDEYVQKSAWGDLCINDKDPDILKRVTVSIQFAEINPDALDIITAANPVVDLSGDTIGASWGTDPNEGAFGLEVWTKRTGVDCTTPGTQEWGYFVVPFIKNGKIDGDIAIENAALTMTVMGEGFATSAWDASPYSPNPFIVPFPDGDVFGMVVTTEQPPTDTAGCVAYPPAP